MDAVTLIYVVIDETTL